MKMNIITGDSKPIKMKTRPVSLGMRKKLLELLSDPENKIKIIEKGSSEWACPIVPVEKKGGSIRLCVDIESHIRRLN